MVFFEMARPSRIPVRTSNYNMQSGITAIPCFRDMIKVSLRPSVVVGEPLKCSSDDLINVLRADRQESARLFEEHKKPVGPEMRAQRALDLLWSARAEDPNNVPNDTELACAFSDANLDAGIFFDMERNVKKAMSNISGLSVLMKNRIPFGLSVGNSDILKAAGISFVEAVPEDHAYVDAPFFMDFFSDRSLLNAGVEFDLKRVIPLLSGIEQGIDITQTGPYKLSIATGAGTLHPSLCSLSLS